jgi:hypothetical protein
MFGQHALAIDRFDGNAGEAAAGHFVEPLAYIRERFHAMAGCGFARIPIAAVDHERVLPEHDGVKIKNSFRAAIGL